MTTKVKETTFILDRFHNGRLMAQGAKVKAKTFEIACLEAKKLFPERKYQNDRFVLRKEADHE